MKERYHVFWEMMLIFASILIFRTIWLLLDKHLDDSLLLPSLAIGIIIAIPSLYILNKHYNN